MNHSLAVALPPCGCHCPPQHPISSPGRGGEGVLGTHSLFWSGDVGGRRHSARWNSRHTQSLSPAVSCLPPTTLHYSTHTFAGPACEQQLERNKKPFLRLDTIEFAVRLAIRWASEALGDMFCTKRNA